MVNHREVGLDRTFSALADPTRRAILGRLDEAGSLSVSEVAKPFAISLPAVLKHLDVLTDTGLIARSKAGRTVTCRLTPVAMKSAMEWLRRYERFWSGSLDRLGAFLEEDRSWPSKPTQNQASRSRAAIKRRPPRSTKPGPTRRK